MPDDADSSTAALILAEVRELRQKQDRRLTALHTLSNAVLGAFLTVGTIAVAAAGSTAGSAAAAVVLVVLALVLSAAATQRASRSWLEGPDVDELVRVYHPNKRGLREKLQIDLIHTLEDHRQRNEEALRNVRSWLRVQVMVACIGAVLLLGTLTFMTNTSAA